MVAHIFNPSTMKMERKSDLAEQREKYKAEGDRIQDSVFCRDDISLRISGDRILPIFGLRI